MGMLLTRDASRQCIFKLVPMGNVPSFYRSCTVCDIALTHWGRVTHICVSKLTIIGSNNGLSPGRRQAIIWTNAGLLLIRTSGTNFSEILGEIHSFSFSKMRLKMSSTKWRLVGLGRNELTGPRYTQHLSLNQEANYGVARNAIYIFK